MLAAPATCTQPTERVLAQAQGAVPDPADQVDPVQGQAAPEVQAAGQARGPAMLFPVTVKA